MSVNVTEQSDERSPETASRQGGVGAFLSNLRTGMNELRWGPVLLFGGVAGLLMPVTLLQAGVLAFVAGIIPVGVGLMLARRVPGNYGLHGFVTGLVAALTSMLLLGAVIFYTPFGAQVILNAGLLGPPPEGAEEFDPSSLDPELLRVILAQAWLTTGGFISVSLITFCTFGATTAGRVEDRNRQLRAEVKARGGALERPGTIRTADDIRGLSLPQFGYYVNSLFKKKGFTFKDYRFIDKDKHLDLWLEHEGTPWHLRLSVADKVTPGTVESLLQDMKREQCEKGIVITSTEFTPGTLKAARDRPVVLIDGQTLYEIAE
ncbi:MAG TPA: restriction endonuclease [Roseiflexaceae bacterium]|nr:restriction endonuclease [Roseiflexaceae bacterium]